MRVELGAVGFDRGGHILVKRALAKLPADGLLELHGGEAALAQQLGAWCRITGHRIESLETRDGSTSATIRKGEAATARIRGAERAGEAGAAHVRSHASPEWGIAARGALVEQGAPRFPFVLHDKDRVWTTDSPRLYAQAAAAQWDPEKAIPWHAAETVDPEIEDAVVQVMTYLIENEMAALVVPSAFLGRIHPHFREVLQVLAIQAADEARHVEVFTRRALLHRRELGLSNAGGQASLRTLFDEPDFATSAFLLSVLGEGSFLALLAFIRDHAPDPVTREIARLTGQDEARHVAFGVAHVAEHVAVDEGLPSRLANAVERRHDALATTAGLNDEVFDALVVLAAGSFEPSAVARGFDAVVRLKQEMDQTRALRLKRLGFSAGEAVVAAHTELHVKRASGSPARRLAATASGAPIDAEAATGAEAPSGAPARRLLAEWVVRERASLAPAPRGAAAASPFRQSRLRATRPSPPP